MLVDIAKIGDLDRAIVAPIASAQMSTTAALRGASFSIITVVQNHLLNITEDRFHRVVVRADFGQADQMRLASSHHAPGLT